jgi:hypothetical protein
MGLHLPGLYSQLVSHIKHLIQAVQPMLPMFFLQVKQNWTLLFWQHPTLVPLEGTLSHLATNPTPPASNKNNGEQEPSEEISNKDEDDADDVVDMEPTLWVGDGSTHCEQLTNTITTIQDFCDGWSTNFNLKTSRCSKL